MAKKSKGYAIASLVFGLTFWIPILNMIFALPAIYFGVKSLRIIRKDQAHFGGKWLAITGLILGALVYITFITGFGMCIYGNSEICRNIGFGLLD